MNFKHAIITALVALAPISGFSQTAGGPVAGVPARSEVAQDSTLERSGVPKLGSPTLNTLGESQEILLLQEAQPFFVRVSERGVYTTNALSDFTEQEDWLLNQSVALGFETVIDERVYFLTELDGSSVRYDQTSLLNRETLTALTSANLTVSENTAVGVSWDSSWFFEEGFDTNDFTFHTGSLYLNRAFALDGGSSLSIGAHARRSWASSSDFDQTAFGLTSSLTIPVSDRATVGFSGNVGYRIYDGFFSELFTEDREDLTLSVGVYAALQMTEHIELLTQVSFGSNDSSLSGTNQLTGGQVGLYDYSTWTVTPSVTVVIHF